MRKTTRLKQLMAARAAVTAPGAANALFARVIEDLGFDVVYVTGAGVANMHLGAPDIGLTTLTELAHATAAIADSVALPSSRRSAATSRARTLSRSTRC